MLIFIWQLWCTYHIISHISPFSYSSNRLHTATPVLLKPSKYFAQKSAKKNSQAFKHFQLAILETRMFYIKYPQKANLPLPRTETAKTILSPLVTKISGSKNRDFNHSSTYFSLVFLGLKINATAKSSTTKMIAFTIVHLSTIVIE